MRITHAVAAAALTAGLAAGAPAAQAAPVTAPVASPVAHGWHAVAPQVAKKAAKAKTRISATAPTQVTAGDDFTVTAKLTRKSGSSYKAYAKQKLAVVVLDAPGADTGEIIDTQKTDKHGKVTFHVVSDSDVAGQSFDFLVAYQGGSKAKASESDVFSIAFTA